MRLPSPGVPGGFTDNLSGLANQFSGYPQQKGAFDFYNTTTEAIKSFWPTPFVAGRDAPRYILTIVGGPDAHDGAWTPAEVESFKQTKVRRPACSRKWRSQC